MPSKPKRWLLAEEDEHHKTLHYESDADSAVWVEIMFDKATERFVKVRCAWNSPGKWHRFAEPIGNYGQAKYKAMEYCLEKAIARE